MALVGATVNEQVPLPDHGPSLSPHPFLCYLKRASRQANAALTPCSERMRANSLFSGLDPALSSTSMSSAAPSPPVSPMASCTVR